MMNKKLVALFVAIVTVSTSVFALFDEVVGGTFRTAEKVGSVPFDAAGAAIDPNTTYSDRREKRKEERKADEQAREEAKRERNRYYDYRR